MFAAFDRLRAGLGQMLQVIATKGIEDIRTRTESGQDKNGQFFRGYSEKYRKRKRQSHVDLRSNERVSKRGRHMLDDMALIVGGEATSFDTLGGGNSGRFRGAGGRFEKAGKQQVSIGFIDPKSDIIAGAQISGARTGKRRDFFGLSGRFLQENVDREFRGVFDNAFRELTKNGTEIRIVI